MQDVQDLLEERIHEAIDEIEEELGEEMNFCLMSEKTAKIIVQWAIAHGHSKEEAYDLLAHAMGAVTD